VFTIFKRRCTSLATTLQGLSESTGGGYQQPTGGMMQTTMMGAGTSIVPLRFTVDNRTNSVIASGSASDLIVVEAILTRWTKGSQSQDEVFRLKNSQAQLVANAVNTFLTTNARSNSKGKPALSRQSSAKWSWWRNPRRTASC